MNPHRNNRTGVALLAVAGAVFLLHAVGMLQPLVLGLALAAGALGAIVLLCHRPGIKSRVRRALNWIERRLISDDSY
jgi:hypothetical protein